jgi:hypothetical protein
MTHLCHSRINFVVTRISGTISGAVSNLINWRAASGCCAGANTTGECDEELDFGWDGTDRLDTRLG